MLKQALALVLCASLVTGGCASAAGARMAQASAPAPAQTRQAAAPTGSTSALADYVQQLPVGSRVHVERVGGASVRGTLMKTTRDTMTVQKHTRVPEPPIDIPLSDVARVTPESGSSSMGRNIAVGVAVGVAATFGVLFLIFATIDD